MFAQVMVHVMNLTSALVNKVTLEIIVKLQCAMVLLLQIKHLCVVVTELAQLLIPVFAVMAIQEILAQIQVAMVFFPMIQMFAQLMVSV